MHTNLKRLFGAASVVTTLVGGPALYAYAQAPNQGSGNMMQGGQGGMMGNQGMGMVDMMKQMSQMMETCNDMMKAHNDNPATPKEGQKSDRKG